MKNSGSVVKNRDAAPPKQIVLGAFFHGFFFVTSLTIT